MQNQPFEILSLRPSKDEASYIAQISFAFRPSDFEPLKVTRRVKTGDKWTTFVDAEIDGARTVRVRSAFLRQSDKGELYVQTNGLQIPWKVNQMVSQAAHEQLQAEAN